MSDTHVEQWLVAARASLAVELPRIEIGAGPFPVRVDGAERTVEVLGCSADTICLTIDGRREALHLAPDAEGIWVVSRGRSRLVRAEGARGGRAARAVPGGPGADGPAIVTPRFPATVVRVLVQPADSVRQGQGLVVVSAMKMEMTLCAPYSGTVRAINAAIGARVAPGDVLVEIEPDPGSGQTEGR